MTTKTEYSSDGRRFADLSKAELLEALATRPGPLPTTMARVNALARVWAEARGFAGSVDWTIDDLVDAGLAVRALATRRQRRRSGRGFVQVGRFRWIDQKTQKLV